MKKFLMIIVTAMALTGCSFAPYHFDQNEYNLLVDLTFTVVKVHSNCSNASNVIMLMPMLKDKADLVDIYVSYSGEDKKMKEAVAIVDVTIRELLIAYEKPQKPSPAYCINKTEIIQGELHHILTAVGSKPQ